MSANTNLNQAQGRLTTIVVPDPVAGSNWVAVVPTDQIWIPVGIEMVFAAAGGGIARKPALAYLNGIMRLAFSPIEGSIASGSSSAIIGFPNHAEEVTAPAAAKDIIPVPFPFRLPGGTILRSLTDNLGAADTYTGIYITVQQILTPVST